MEEVYRVIVIIVDKLRDKKLQYDTTRAAAKLSALSSGKIDKYEYLTGEEILPPQQHRIIQEAKFTYIFGKALEKQRVRIEKHSEKPFHNKSLESRDKKSSSIKMFVSERMRDPEIMKKLEHRTRTKK